MQLFVKDFCSKNIFTLVVSQDEIIKNIREQIEHIIDGRVDDSRLVFSSKNLNDEYTLADYNIPNNSTLNLIPRIRGGMMIKITTITGKQFELNVDEQDKELTIFNIKEKVEEKEGIPPNQQFLIVSGKQIADETKFIDSGIKAGDIVHLILNFRGGR